MLKRMLHSNAGSAFVELALVLPVLSLILVGAAEMGRLAYAAIEVSNAARAGVAYGAQDNGHAALTTYMEQAATQDSSDVASISAVASSCVCPTLDATTYVPACSFPLGTTPCSTYASETEFVQVNTTATVDTGFHLPGLPQSYTLHGSATMRVNLQ